jgi:hypothetical protein
METTMSILYCVWEIKQNNHCIVAMTIVTVMHISC